MKERPVIFNGEMVRAILDGRKTQTRRTLNWKRQPYTEMAERDDGSLWPWAEDGERGGDIWFPCPFGEVGDRLWVRETFAVFDADWKHPGKPHDLRDGPWPNVVYPASVAKIPDGTCRPSIHMPRWASRIALEITAVRVERLNDISEEDAKSEGVKAGICPGHEHMMHQVAFSELWQSIYGAENWSANPWVWVIEFRRVEVRDASK
ncbi:ASCH domain-containing protein [Serratia entomophila]|uniref:hypothetical protein n=1 Tax=Serratia entomophila TaxID=42906 RepID=UPI0021BA80F1|nr:hypothetical protein [Serratia entomophila]